MTTVNEVNPSSAKAAGATTAYVGQVATNCYAPSAALTANRFMSSSRHFIRGSDKVLQLVLPGFSGGDAAPLANQVAYQATIEHPAGVFTRFTFGGGLNTGHCAAGDIAFSDPISVASIPTGSVNIRVYGIVPDGGQIPVNVLLLDTANGETYASGPSITSALFASSTLPNDGSGYCFRPLAILSNTTTPSALIIGDSRAESYFDVQDGSTNMGVTARWIGPNFGYINLAIGGSTVGQFAASFAVRARLATYCSALVVEGDVNGFLGTVSDAQLRTDVGTVKTKYTGPTSAFLQTISPAATLAPGWTATTGQSDIGELSTTVSDPRKTHNDWRRTVPTGWAGCFDTTTITEAQPVNSGRWADTAYTGDGVHESHTCNLAVASSFTAPAKTKLLAAYAPPNTGVLVAYAA